MIYNLLEFVYEWIRSLNIAVNQDLITKQLVFDEIFVFFKSKFLSVIE